MTGVRQHRRAITLVELLVVISILGTLAGIVAMFAPRMLEQSRVPEGARQLQGWLQIARQRAIRDQTPRGIRLVNPQLPQESNDYLQNGVPTSPGTADQIFYRRFAYIEQPDDLTGRPFPVTTPPLNAFMLDRDLSGTVKAGDVVEVDFTRYYITGCVPVAPVSRIDLHRIPDLIGSSASYRITRGMQPIVGEPELQMPVGVAVDAIRELTPGETRTYPPLASGTGFFDIVFSRTGEVVNNLGTYGRIILWTRDTSLGEAERIGQPGVINRGGLPPGDNRLIVIHTRTGQVTAHPVFQDMDSAGKLLDPYRYIRDGKSSAME